MTDVTVLSAHRATAAAPWLTLGEGPVWDDVSAHVLWVDIQAGIVYEGLLQADMVTVVGMTEFGETVGAALPAADGGLVVAGARHLRILGPDRRHSSAVRLVHDSVASRLNDAACDPAGRLLVGTLALDGRTGQERLLSLAADGRSQTVVDGLTLSNGIAFSPDGSTMYLIDSIPGIVWAFDYDVSTGRAGSRRTVWGPGDAVPDGLAVDVDGRLWVACFGAGQVRCLAPDGEWLAVVEVPAPNTTCPAFVGPDRDRLLITTAREQLTDAELDRWPESGSLFLADVAVAGVPTPAWSGSTVRQTGPDEDPQTTEGNAP
jgi:sugar lactone lactonase YvrE